MTAVRDYQSPGPPSCRAAAPVTGPPWSRSSGRRDRFLEYGVVHHAAFGDAALLGELGAVEVAVEAAGLEQLEVGATLEDPAAVDHEDLVGAADGRQPVGDDQRGAPRQRRVEGALHRGLGLAIEVGGGLV